MANKAEKIVIVQGMIANGSTREEIHNFINNETDWDIQESTIDRYIEDAGGIEAAKTDEPTEDQTEAPETEAPNTDSGETETKEAPKEDETVEEEKEVKAPSIKNREIEQMKTISDKRASATEKMELIYSAVSDMIEVIEDCMPELDSHGNIRRCKMLKDQLIRFRKNALKAYKPKEEDVD